MEHLGISKCQARAKTTVFWPNIDLDINQLIARCEVCCENQHAPPSYDEHSVELTFQVIYMGLIYAILKERYTLYVWITLYSLYGSNHYQTCNLRQ